MYVFMVLRVLTHLIYLVLIVGVLTLGFFEVFRYMLKKQRRLKIRERNKKR